MAWLKSNKETHTPAHTHTHTPNTLPNTSKRIVHGLPRKDITQIYGLIQLPLLLTVLLGQPRATTNPCVENSRDNIITHH